VAGLGLLDRVYRQRADRVDAEPVDDLDPIEIATWDISRL
jgi:hypothetical protein